MVNVDILCANALQSKFNINQIFHDNLPESGKYPMVVYTDVSESPALHADNKLYAKEHIIRVTLVTNGNTTINALKQDIEDCMTSAGFMWMNTAKVRDKNEYYTSLDFSFGNEGN
jgi:hypothetical protein